MGYRFEVVLAFSKEAKTVLLVNDKNFPYVTNEIVSNDFQELEDGTTVFKFHEIKWYPSYPMIMAFDAIMDLLDEQGYDATYCYGRVGEEIGDAETRGGLNEERKFQFFEPCQSLMMYF